MLYIRYMYQVKGLPTAEENCFCEVLSGSFNILHFTQFATATSCSTLHIPRYSGLSKCYVSENLLTGYAMFRIFYVYTILTASTF